MWVDDPDMMDAYEEYDYETETESESESEPESDEDLDDLAFDSVIAADVDDGTFDNEGDYFDDDD